MGRTLEKFVSYSSLACDFQAFLPASCLGYAGNPEVRFIGGTGRKKSNEKKKKIKLMLRFTFFSGYLRTSNNLSLKKILLFNFQLLHSWLLNFDARSGW